MNLYQFQNTFRESFQQGNRYRLHINFESGLASVPLHARLLANAGNRSVEVEQALTWLAQGALCDRARVPDRAFDTVQMTQYGITEQFPYKSDYTALDCSFLLPIHNGRNVLSQVFTLWMNAVQNIQDGLGSDRDFTWPSDYYATAKLFTLDRTNRTTACYVFERLYPKAVESIPVTWTEESEIARLNVSFVFTSWHMTDEAAPLLADDRQQETSYEIPRFKPVETSRITSGV
jgi:hypothetical protein